MQRVGDNVALGMGKTQTRDDQVFADGCTGHKADGGGRDVNQFRDQLFHLVAGWRIRKPCRTSGLPLQVRLNRAAHSGAQRVPSRVVQERGGLRDGKIGPGRELRRNRRLRGKPKLEGGARRSTGGCPGEPATPIQVHTSLPARMASLPIERKQGGRAAADNEGPLESAHEAGLICFLMGGHDPRSSRTTWLECVFI